MRALLQAVPCRLLAQPLAWPGRRALSVRRAIQELQQAEACASHECTRGGHALVWEPEYGGAPSVTRADSSGSLSALGARRRRRQTALAGVLCLSGGAAAALYLDLNREDAGVSISPDNLAPSSHLSHPFEQTIQERLREVMLLEEQRKIELHALHTSAGGKNVQKRKKEVEVDLIKLQGKRDLLLEEAKDTLLSNSSFEKL